MHKPNFTAQLSNKEAVREAASQIGCTHSRGREKGLGSIRDMLENIAQGDVLVLFHEYDEPAEMLADAAKLREMAEPLYPHKLQTTLLGLAAALENAAGRKD